MDEERGLKGKERRGEEGGGDGIKRKSRKRTEDKSNDWQPE